MIYVVSQNGKPLMPCSNTITRLLLKQGKAQVKKREQFTIKLTHEVNILNGKVKRINYDNNTLFL